jgi:diaminopimelate decarboxylase
MLGNELGKSGENHPTLNGVNLVELCETHGTPLFIFDERCLRENYRRFREAFAKQYPKVALCYSVKTNSNLALCKIMCEEGAFAGIVSSLDLHIALKAGFPPHRLVLDGLYKPEALLRKALRLDVLLINAESFQELELLNQLAREEGRRPRVGLRLSIYERSFPYLEALYSNPASRYGFPFEDTLRILEKAEEFENLDICGVMVHPYRKIRRFLPLLRRMQDILNLKMKFLDIGGGFNKVSSRIGTVDLVKCAIRERLGMTCSLPRLPKQARQIEEEAHMISSKIRSTLGHAESTLVLEPGRYLVHDAGFLALRAGLVKKASGRKWIVVDAGTNLVPDFHENREICVAKRTEAQPEEVVNISGPLLSGWDLVAMRKALPQVRAGDLVVLSNVGAYTLSWSRQFCYPRPAVVLVRPNGNTVLIRQEETCEDVMRMDRTEGLVA